MHNSFAVPNITPPVKRSVPNITYKTFLPPLTTLVQVGTVGLLIRQSYILKRCVPNVGVITQTVYQNSDPFNAKLEMLLVPQKGARYFTNTAK